MPNATARPRGHTCGPDESPHPCRACRRGWSRWYDMIRRCTRPSYKQWKDYGGRGITVCGRWRDSFDAYYEDTGDPPFGGATIDRVDNDGNYACGQCPGEVKNWRWATRLEQNWNVRNPRGARTHCPQGHAYDEANTYVWRGWRSCRACIRAKQIRYNRRKAQRLTNAAH